MPCEREKEVVRYYLSFRRRLSRCKWLDLLEEYLETKGLLKRNPGRAGAAVMGSARAFLKAEKQLWKCLEFVVPYGARVFHPGRDLSSIGKGSLILFKMQTNDIYAI